MKLILLVVTFVSLSAFGNNLKNSARDTLIQKFERIYLQLPDNNPSKVSVVLRLADLLSERARLSAMNELKSGCIQCTAGVSDRKKAIKYYSEVLEKIETSQKSRVLTQLGHLYELTGQSPKAIELYKQSIASTQDAAFKAAAELALAEIHFKRGQFQMALSRYEKVLAIEEAKKHSLAAHRRAWCLFNLGRAQEAEEALLTIINTPKLLSRSQSEVVSVDSQYKSEIARDLATFMAKNGAGLNKAKILYHHSPESVKLSNVSYLAAELERLGQKSEAVEVYRFAIERQSSPKDRLRDYIRVSQLEMEVKNVEQSLKDYEKSLDLWKQSQPCDFHECTEWKTRLRKYVLDWHRLEKLKPSIQLVSAYELYRGTFSTEIDMGLWQIDIHRNNKEWMKALAVYKQITDLVLAEKATKGANNKESLPGAEELLLAQVDIAERVGEKELLIQVYNRYLGTSQEKTRELEVRYQLAHMQYKEEKFNLAAESMREVALFKGETNSEGLVLKERAANLALDSLVLVKDNPRIEAWASEFAGLFPKSKKEFSGIARKSVMNQSAQLAKTDPGSALATLSRFDEKEATREEIINYYRNRMILAEKLGRYSEARQSADKLLSIKSLSKEDRKLALQRKAFIAELQLDFKTALNIMGQLKMPELNKDQKALKMALFSELAGKSADKHYKSFIQHSKDDEKNFVIAMRLVENSKTPLKTLKKFKSLLIKKPEVYGTKYLELLAKDYNPKRGFTKQQVSEFSRDATLKTTGAGRFVRRQDFMRRLEVDAVKLEAHQLDTKNQRRLNRSIKARVKGLDKLETLAKEAVESEDWASQLMSLSHLGKESNRFYQDLLSLPMPEGLTPQEQMQYMNLLAQQAQPYRVKSEELVSKEKELWNDPDIVKNYGEQFKNLSETLRPLLSVEIQRVSDLAPMEVKEPLLQTMNYQDPEPVLPSFKDIEIARQKVQREPMNLNKLKQLRQLEEKMGSKAMVSYLDTRIEKVEGEQKQ